MTAGTSGESERKSKLEQVLAEYLRSMERGHPLDRQELVAQHPDLADELTSFFENREALQRFARPFRDPPADFDETLGTLSDQPPEARRVRYFGDYELLEEIARGGMGVVYKARQTSLQRIVALKMILSGQLAGEDEVKRFSTEAEAAARLNHPNIVPIFEVGEHEGQHYFSMAFIEGPSLAHRLATGVLPPAEAATLVKKVSEAIAYAHVEGVIHRDLKPGNVLLDRDGEPHVTDFGLAKRLEVDSSLTKTGQVLGTPAYVPPEQARGATSDVGPHSDIYSLGAVLYCLLTGRPPFQAATAVDTLLQVLHQEPVAPRQLNPAIPRDLDTICLKCLAKEPRRRFRSAQELADELQRFLDGKPIRARAVGRPERVWRWCRRNPIVASLSSGLLVALVAGVAGVTSQWIRAERQSAQATRQEQLTRHYLYAAHMHLAHESWQVADVAEMDQRLDRWIPQGADPDLRGWEWYYLRSLRQRDQLVLKAHTFAQAVACSPDGNWIASAGFDSQLPGSAGNGGFAVKLWDAATGKLIHTLPLPDHYDVNALAFSPDSRQLACARGFSLTVWDTQTWRPTLRHTGEKEISAAVWSPNGHHLASAGVDQLITLWNAENGERDRLLTGHTKWVTNVVFHPDGSRLASACQDGTTRLWRIDTGEEEFQLAGGPGALCFSNDGRRLIQADSDNTLNVWDLENKTVVRTLRGHTQPVAAVAFCPVSNRVASGSWDRTIRVWDVDSASEVVVLQGHSGILRSLAWSPAGDRIVSASVDGTVRVWNATGEQNPVLGVNYSDIMSLAWSPDSTQLASGNADNTVRVWDVAAREEVRTISGHGAHVLSVAWSPGGAQLASADRDGTVKVWDATSGDELSSRAGAGSNVRWHSDRRLASWPATPPSEKPANALFAFPGVEIWDAVSGEELEFVALPHDNHAPRQLSSVDWSADGRLLAFCQNSMVRLCEAPTEREIWTLDDETGPVLFSPDGKQFVTATRIWDVTTRRLAATLSIAGVTPVAWSPDGRRLVAVDLEAIRIFDAVTGEEVLRFRELAARVAKWSPDGRWLAAGDQHGRIRLWEAWPTSKGE